MSPVDADQLRAALAAGQFFHAYQPVVELSTGRVPYVEALIRWAHPTLGELTPGSFLSLVHGAGLSDALTDFGLSEVIEDLPRLRRVYGDDVAVALNLAHPQLRRPEEAVDRIIATVGSASEPAGSLRIEIVEDVTRDDIERSSAALGRLRSEGIAVILDDFGTGASSLTALTEMVYDGLKIDRSFVRALGSSGAARSVVETILDFGTRTSTSVVAEGVETDEEVRVLEELGCRLAQGYALGRPKPIDEQSAAISRFAPSAEVPPAAADPVRLEELRLAIDEIDPRSVQEFGEARRELLELFTEAEQLGPAAATIRCDLCRRLALAAFYEGDAEGLDAWASRSVQIAEELKDWGRAAAGLTLHASNVVDPNGRGTQVDSLIRALDLRMTKPMDAEYGAWVDNGIGVVFGVLGLWEHARLWWKDAIDRQGPSQTPGAALCCLNLCELELDQCETVFDPRGGADRALSIAQAEQALAIAHANPHTLPSVAASFTARLRILQDDLDGAEAALAASAEPPSSVLDALQLAKARALIARRGGDPSAFVAHTTELTSILARVKIMRHHEHIARQLHVEALEMAGHSGEGLGELHDLYSELRRQSATRLTTLFDWLRTHVDLNLRLRELLDIEPEPAAAM